MTPLLLEVEQANQSATLPRSLELVLVSFKPANQSATLPLALLLVSFKPMLSEPKLVKQPQRQSPLAHQPELNLLAQDKPM